MDLDRYVVRNAPMWSRLEELTVRATHRRHPLAPPEVDELVALYQRASAQLAHVRTYFGDEGLNARLTGLVAGANAAIHGAPATGGAGRAIGQFFSVTFPAAVYTQRRFVAVAAALMLVPAIAFGAWLSHSDEARSVAAPDAAARAYLDYEFEDYYSSTAAAEFSTAVLVNNIKVSFFAFAFGVLLCIPTAILLVTNGLGVGLAGGLFVHAGEAGKFFGLILPHGLLELTSIIIAGAAGLSLGWAVIAPGADRTRGEALAEEGRRSVVIVLGLMLCFVVAGLIEGFVTPSGLPTGVRVATGVLVEALFISWIVSRGRAAVLAGHRGAFTG